VGNNFHFSMSSRPALGPTQPLSQWVPGALSPGVKWAGREADHPQSVKHKDNFTFYLYYMNSVNIEEIHYVEAKLKLYNEEYNDFALHVQCYEMLT
jgi:hypothetical protein